MSCCFVDLAALRARTAIRRYNINVYPQDCSLNKQNFEHVLRFACLLLFRLSLMMTSARLSLLLVDALDLRT